jgi:hypothetical protein
VAGFAGVALAGALAVLPAVAGFAGLALAVAALAGVGFAGALAAVGFVVALAVATLTGVALTGLALAGAAFAGVPFAGVAVFVRCAGTAPLTVSSAGRAVRRDDVPRAAGRARRAAEPAGEPPSRS